MNNTELAKRLVACKGFRWMPGMLATDKYRYLGNCVWCDVWEHALEYEPTIELPDLTDPATLGCLLPLVREALGNPYFFVEASAMYPYEQPYTYKWNSDFQFKADSDAWTASSEAEALVMVLETLDSLDR